MKILITGVNGFVGGHLAERLITNPSYQLYGIARSSSLALPSLADHVSLVTLDLRDTMALKGCIADIAPDVIIHLAAQASVAKSFNDPLGTMLDNVMPSVALMQYAVELKLDPLCIFAGSNEIFGMVAPDEMPINEQQPLRPVTPYGVSKASVDMAAYQWFVSHKVRTIRLRLFSHIGPRQSDAYAISAFAAQIAKIEAGLQEPVLKVGNLSARRDITDVRDIADAYEALIHHGVPGTAYNVGSGVSYEIRTLLDKLVAQSSVPIQVEVDPARLRPVDVPNVVCDNSQLFADTGYHPHIPIDTTLKDMLDYWRRTIKESKA
ncbi:MAG: GDP-mannose 4,6-dehydratase [Roseiflexaceae bacterium]